MSQKYKRTICALLVLVNIVKTNSNGVLLENKGSTTVTKSNLVSSIRGENLLRGGNERAEPPIEMGDFRNRKQPQQDTLPMYNGALGYQNINQHMMNVFSVDDENPMKLSPGDFSVNPATGEMMIHNPSQQATNEHYFIRPDIPLKDLQGYFMPSADDSAILPTTESSEEPTDPDSNVSNEQKLPTTEDQLQFNSNQLQKESNDRAPILSTQQNDDDSSYYNNRSSEIPTPTNDEPAEFMNRQSVESRMDINQNTEFESPESEVVKEPMIEQQIEEEPNKEDDAPTPEYPETALPTTMSESEIEIQRDDLGEDVTNVYKFNETTSKTNYEFNYENGAMSSNNVESITRGAMPTRTPAVKTTQKEAATTPLTTETVSPGFSVGSRIDPAALTAATENSGQRTPKLDKATPTTMDKRNFEPRRPVIKLSKRDTLRSWFEDPWLRAPAGILIPLQARSISRALAVWHEITEPEGLNLTDVLLIGYDINGISWLTKPTGASSVAGALNKLLSKYQGVMSTDGKADAALHACAWAAKLVPYDSALFILTDRAPSDAEKLPAALRAMIDKRLKLYTIWTDPMYPTSSSEAAVTELQKASQYTEGEFIDYHPPITAVNEAGNLASESSSWGRSGYRTSANVAVQAMRSGRLNTGIRERVETLLVRRGGSEHLPLGVPVEDGVRSLRIRIDGRVDRAALYPPSGPQIDLFNATSVSDFSAGSRLASVVPLDALLLFPNFQDQNTDKSYRVLAAQAVEAGAGDPQRKPTVGTWRLSVRCHSCDYRVLVTAIAPIGLDSTMIGDDLLRIRVKGPVASVRETTLIDEFGTELAKLPFSHQPSAGDESLESEAVGDGSGLPALVADVPLPPIKRSSKVYTRVVGRDIHGESFVRLAGPIFKNQETRTGRSAAITFPDDASELQDLDDTRTQRLFFNNNNETNTYLPPSTATSQITGQAGTLLTTVQIGLGSRLYGTAGDNLQIHFEVTNYRERSINFRFEASGNLRFLRGIRPTTQWISSGQTVNVIVDVGITAGAQLGARDLITFTATGLEQVSISAYVYVVSPEILVTDVWAPQVRHVFHGDCMLKQGSDCAQHTWATTIYARDSDGGILRISSSPLGVRYESNFVAGTREEVTATYRATCCATRLLINAVDSNGNANTYTIDIGPYLTGAAIAAIALGCLLAIALICVIAFIVYILVRRRKESRQLPSYATPRQT